MQELNDPHFRPKRPIICQPLKRREHKANWRDKDKTRVQIFEHLAVQIKPAQYSSKHRISPGIIANKFSCPKILLHSKQLLGFRLKANPPITWFKSFKNVYTCPYFTVGLSELYKIDQSRER